MTMTQSNRTWLTIWAWGVVIFGVVLATFAVPAVDGLGRMIFELLGNPAPAEPDAHLRFSVGLMGCVTIGWGVTILAAFRAAWALPPAQASGIWRLIVISAFSWFIPDSLLSIATGFGLNVVSNVVLLVLLLVPVLRSGVLKAA
jgi:hypothetical protein